MNGLRTITRRSILFASVSLSATAASPTEENKKLVRQWLADVDQRGVTRAVIDKWLAPEFRLHFAGVPTPIGIAQYGDFAGGFYQNFSELRHDVQQMVAEADRVAVWTVVQGRHTGPYQGIAPTGRRIAVVESIMVRIKNRRIVEEWVSFDNATLIDQLRGPA